MFQLQVLQVEVNLAIRSMGPVDERKQEFTFDCYFRWSGRSSSSVLQAVLDGPAAQF